MDELKNLIEISEMAFEYIDAIPKTVELPAMPGFDRDEANAILDSAKTKLKNLGEGEAETGYALLSDVMSKMELLSFLNDRTDLLVINIEDVERVLRHYFLPNVDDIGSWSRLKLVI